MKLLKLAFCVLLLLIATQAKPQTISVSGSGAYTSFNYQSSPSAWTNPISTHIAFSFAFPSSISPCPVVGYCWDPGTYRSSPSVPASPMGLNPVLDDFFNSQLSSINPNLNTTLINALAPADIVIPAASRSRVVDVTDTAVYRWTTDNWTMVLTDSAFNYQVQWQSYVNVYARYSVPDVDGYVSQPFEAKDVASWFNGNSVFMDDWLMIFKTPIGGNLSTGTRYVIEASGSGNVVAAVPEPSIYVMMLAGLGMLGWVTRRRLVSVTSNCRE